MGDSQETVEKLETIKSIRSKVYWLSRTTGQLRVNVDEVEKARELQEECRRVLAELDAEEKRYTDALREIKADVAAMSQTIAKLDFHIRSNQDDAIILLSNTCQPARIAMNQLLATVGLPNIKRSTEEDTVSEWALNVGSKRSHTRTSVKSKRNDNSKDRFTSPAKKQNLFETC